MRRARWAAVGAIAVGAGCELLAGVRNVGPYPAGMGGTGTASTGSAGGMDGGNLSDAASDGGTGRGIWSKSFGTLYSLTTVNAITVDTDGNIYLAGSSDPTLDFGCNNAVIREVDTGSAYLLELSTDGVCQWLLRFGHNAQATGVAFDPEMGTLALTGTFGTSTLSGEVTLDPSWTMSSAARQRTHSSRSSTLAITSPGFARLPMKA